MTEKTRNIINAAALQKTKKGVRIINCARGGLVVEAALAEAIQSGHVAGAALDVFEEEPAKTNPLFGLPNVICTPHLGASTTEAQENVALQVAEQMADYLLTGAISNAVNFPSISAEEAPRLKPFVKLAEQLGPFAGQITETGFKRIRLEYSGEIGDLNTRALTSAALTGVLRPLLAGRQHGLRALHREGARHHGRGSAPRPGGRLRDLYARRRGDRTAGSIRSPARSSPTAGRGSSRCSASISKPSLARTCSTPKTRISPAISARWARLSAYAGVNIATFTLGREGAGGKATALIGVDDRITDGVLAKVRDLPHVVRAERLAF